MPQIRKYPQANSVESTDAFVIDRLGLGTMYVEGGDLPTGNGVVTTGTMIHASLPEGITDNWAPTGWDTGVDAIIVGAAAGTSSILVGLTGGTADRRVVLGSYYANGVGGTLTIQGANSATNANQFYTPGSATISVNTDGAVACVYDAVGDSGGSGPGYGPGWRVQLPSPPPPPPPSSSPVAFRAELVNGNVNLPMGGPTGPNILVDTAVFDTASGFAVATTPGEYHGLGDVSVYTIQTAGIYLFHLQIYFQVSSGLSTAKPVNIFLDVEWLNATGVTIKYSFGSNSTGGLAIYSPSSEGTNQFSCDLTFMVNAAVGDFFIPFVDDQTGSMYADLSLIAGFNTAFEGHLVSFSSGGSGGGNNMIYATLPTGTTDNWAPDGWVTGVDAVMIACSSSNSTLVGLAGGTADRRVVLGNYFLNDTTGGTLTIDPAASSTNANQFYTPGSTSITVALDGSVSCVYDATGDQGGSGPGYGPGWRVILPAS